MVSIYPNPFTNVLIIEDLGRKYTNLEIFDSNGKKCVEFVNPVDQVRIEMSEFNHGLYLISLKNAEKTLLKKVIKK